MAKEIRIFRLKMINHPDIIAFVSECEDDATSIELEHPHALMSKGQAQASMELQLVPYIPGYAADTENKMRISKSDIFTSFVPVDDLKIRFEAAFGSGLILPGNNTVRVPTAQIGTALP